ncbi:ROK family transcriptional regulator [Isoptericola dokdonensis]|uniref:N-acetylglucosamine repressor n=1 Tax=Isoptericola dokdonensis DS-3 TaxID=1300344 RepID=A0A161IEK9_9MICO|nr:ROK family transcriptional regulator [Isoptericola dokdonensis]ANC31807.1 N-acetylglucosamine repressor [Isoptericola dokdonensis DS-3]
MTTTPEHDDLAPVLRALRDGLPRTRAQLARELGLSRSTMSTRVDDLLALGLVAPTGDAGSTGGRPASTFAFTPGARIVAGVDLGATHARIVLTDLAAHEIADHREEVCIASGPGPVLDRVVEVVHTLLAEAGRDLADLAGVGVGLPGPVDHASGRPTKPPIMPGWDGHDVAGHLHAGLGSAPVLVDNDVNLMALAEHSSALPQVEHLLFVKVATGIGAGIIADGRVHRGAQGSAGDLGHVAVPGGEPVPCTCGNTGCLEAVAGAAAVAARLREHGVEARTSDDVVALVRGGNIVATQAVRDAGRAVGAVLASCVSLLNPSAIVVGGSMARVGEHLVAGIREVVYARPLPLATQNLRVTTSRIGAHAGALGGAWLAVENAFDTPGLLTRGTAGAADALSPVAPLPAAQVG